MSGVNVSRGLALLTAIGLASAFQEPGPAREPTRRAVVVGIDRYRTATPQPPVLPRSGRLLPKGPSGQRNWSDLEGAVNDAESIKALLTGRLGFDPRQIVTLENEQASADAILAAIQKHLIDQARPGDISVFYFAGHGSQIRNTRTTEPSGLDQTIVPADAPQGTPDIRDKELARIFRAGLSKGVLLSAVFDSCHSGSIARGLWNPAGKTRSLEPAAGYVEDPPDLDASGKPLPNPETSGMLVLSAAQDTQTAAETNTGTAAHGLFTWAFLKVMQTVPPNERADRVFQRVRALMQSEGTLQEPVLAGAGPNGRSLLGIPSDGVNTLTAAVERAWDNRVRLQAGAGIGLNEGCELRRIEPHGKPDGPRIRIQQILGLSSSEATVLDAAADIRAGDLFQVVRWTAPDTAALRVFVPRAPLTLDQLSKFASTLSSLGHGIRWIDDPTRESPSHVISWSQGAWILEQNPAQGAAVNLGEKPSAAALAAALPPGARLFLLLPVPESLAASLSIGPQSPNDAITLETAPARAHYALYGRYSAGKVAYAWVLPNVTEASLAERFASPHAGLPPAMAMPIRSDWFTRPDGLTGAALKLGRIHGWLQLDAPVDGVRFPYHLALQEKVAAGPLITAGTVHEGQTFQLVLTADRDRLQTAIASDALVPRRVYVFCIDHDGASTLLYPPPGQGDVENRFPVILAGAGPPAIIPLPGHFQITAPFAVDTYFLLTSEEPLPSPEVLEFSGVRGPAETRGALDPLGRLISRTFDGRRGVPPAVPMNWSVERLVFRSVAKGESSAPLKP